MLLFSISIIRAESMIQTSVPASKFYFVLPSWLDINDMPYHEMAALTQKNV